MHTYKSSNIYQHWRPNGNSWKSFDYNMINWLNFQNLYLDSTEIKESIIEAMYHAFYEQRDFTTEDYYVQRYFCGDYHRDHLEAHPSQMDDQESLKEK